MECSAARLIAEMSVSGTDVSFDSLKIPSEDTILIVHVIMKSERLTRREFKQLHVNHSKCLSVMLDIWLIECCVSPIDLYV